jgi:hypothetical protein
MSVLQSQAHLELKPLHTTADRLAASQKPSFRIYQDEGFIARFDVTGARRYEWVFTLKEGSLRPVKINITKV